MTAALFTLRLIAALNQSLDFRHVKAFDTTLSCARRIEMQLTTNLFDNILSLIVVHMSFAPQSQRLRNYFGEVIA
jgi:hypothetical protein